MTVALVLGALLAVAVVFAAVRRGVHGEPTTMKLVPTNKEPSAVGSQR